MSVQAAVLSVPSAFEQVTGHYGSLLAICRESILQDIESAPAAQHLTAYFERGKMLRPLLVFLAAAAVGGDAAAALPGAEALELLHGAALVHDDIMDRADERRGLPALHAVVGKPAALVIGDYLILRSFEVLARAAEATNPYRVFDAMRLLSRHAQDCCCGQIQELSPGATSCSEQQYYAIIQGKTASQFSAAVTLGSTFGQASDQEMEALQCFALNAGMAFQIRDDELDFIGDVAKLGKPIGNSVAAGRPLLPLIYLNEYGSPSTVARYREMQQDGSTHAALVDLLEQEGLFEEVQDVEHKFLERALAALDRMHPSREQEALKAIGVYCISRNC